MMVGCRARADSASTDTVALLTVVAGSCGAGAWRAWAAGLGVRRLGVGAAVCGAVDD